MVVIRAAEVEKEIDVRALDAARLQAGAGMTSGSRICRQTVVHDGLPSLCLHGSIIREG
jgi:hypothetical protein